MNRDTQRLRDYLGHILEAIERIQRYVADMEKADYLASQIVQDAVIRNFEVIGEASRNIQRAHPAFAAAHPELHWPSPTTCAMPWRTVISRWTSTSCGRRSTASCRHCMRT